MSEEGRVMPSERRKTTLQQTGNTRSCAKRLWAPGGFASARTQSRIEPDNDEPAGKLIMQGCMWVSTLASLKSGRPAEESQGQNATREIRP